MFYDVFYTFVDHNFNISTEHLTWTTFADSIDHAIELFVRCFEDFDSDYERLIEKVVLNSNIHIGGKHE